MHKLKERAVLFLRSEDGPTATEYAVMLGIIAVAVIATMTTFGNKVSNIYSIIDGATPTG